MDFLSSRTFLSFLVLFVSNSSFSDEMAYYSYSTCCVSYSHRLSLSWSLELSYETSLS